MHKNSAAVFLGDWGHEYIVEHDGCVRISGPAYGMEGMARLRIPASDALELGLDSVANNAPKTISQLRASVAAKQAEIDALRRERVK